MKKVFAIFTALLFFGACFTFTGCKQDTDVTKEKKTVVTEAIEAPEVTESTEE